jgi:hypothetical protein
MAELLVTSQVGAREDLADLIAIADQKATPLVSAARKSTAPTNPLFSWLVDGYDTPNTNGVLSNEDATTFANPAAQRERLYGRIQKLWRLPKVSDLAENVSDVAGIGTKREMARAIKKSIQELARDLEATFCSDQDSQAESGNNPFKTRGLGSWISNSAQADSGTAVPAAYRTPAASISTATIANTTDTVVQGLLQSIYEQTGKGKTFTLLCGPTLKRAFTSMTQVQFGSTNTAATVRVYNADLSDNKIEQKVDIFVGDFGELLLVPDLYLRTDVSTAASLRSGFILDMDGIHIRYNRRPAYKPLPDLGGGPRGIVDTIAALQVDNPLTHGKIATAS